MEKLKNRWGLKTNKDIIAVFCAFAVNGTLSSYLGNSIMNILNLSLNNTSKWIYYPLKFILITIMWHITLPIIGWLFGQYNFFINFLKKLLNRYKLYK